MSASLPIILTRLRRLGTQRNIAGMARFGITSKKVFGVGAGPLRLLAKNIGRDHARAHQLWKSGWLEARILAAFIDDPKLVTRRQMNAWVREFDNWAVCDGVCLHLFVKTRFAHEAAVRWCVRKAEFVKRAGFVMMAVLAVHDKEATDSVFRRYLRVIERSATDERNFVKKSVNWALRQIGKRNRRLGKEAMKVARRLAASGSSAARWVGSDAAREFAGKGIG